MASDASDAETAPDGNAAPDAGADASTGAPDTVLDGAPDFDALRDAADAVRTEIHRLLVGQDRMVDLLLTALLADGHVLIEGVPGTAKTLTARLLARTLDVDFTRIQFTPDLMPSDILGTSVFNPDTADFSFRKGPIFSNIVLIDEVNRAPAKTQAALFEVMEESQVSAEGRTFALEAPFMVLATQNPLEHEGTYRLPEAQLDRFLFRIDVNYPSLEEETGILQAHHAGRTPKNLDAVEAVLDADALAGFRQQVEGEVHVEEALMDYIARLARATREHSALALGASPRASVMLLRTAKAWAALDGRDYVTPDDIHAVAPAALRHRLLLTPEQEMEGYATDDVIQRVFDQVDVPR
jgi:MoxR-like ATPase